MAEKRANAGENPVTPRDASSLLLLRGASTPGKLEVLMVRRHSRSPFAGGMHVFPGGELEDGDRDPGWEKLCREPSPGELEKLCGDGTSRGKALGLMVAGIRELFEETGILLASRDPEESIPNPGRESELLREYRVELRSGKLLFQDVVRDLDLKLDLDRLVFFAHWITPEISPIRYDTRFFLAPAPSGQEPDHDREEITACIWVEPGTALRMCSEGEFPLLPPTMANLYILADFHAVHEALEAAREREVPTIMPHFGSPDR